MQIEYHINQDQGKVVITDTEGQHHQALNNVSITWLKNELARIQVKYPKARVRIIDKS